MRQQLHPGIWLSTPEATREEMQTMHEQLVTILRDAHAKDVDLSDLISGALMELAEQFPRGAHEVIIHRNGSWEAEHVFRLAGGVDRLEWDTIPAFFVIQPSARPPES